MSNKIRGQCGANFKTKISISWFGTWLQKGHFFFVFSIGGKSVFQILCVWGGDNEKEIYGNPDGLSIYHYCNLIVSSRNVPISLDVAVPQTSSTWRHWKIARKTHTTGPPQVYGSWNSWGVFVFTQKLTSFSFCKLQLHWKIRLKHIRCSFPYTPGGSFQITAGFAWKWSAWVWQV